MNKTRIYTDEEIRVLSSNPNVVRIRNKRICGVVLLMPIKNMQYFY